MSEKLRDFYQKKWHEKYNNTRSGYSTTSEDNFVEWSQELIIELGYLLVESVKPLFLYGDFTLHSGRQSDWLIDCTTLTDKDWEALAYIISSRVQFSRVIGVPDGGLKLANALKPYCQPGYSTLVVDDVLTTGASMEEARNEVAGEVIGYVIFARGECPYWVKAVWYSSQFSWPVITGYHISYCPHCGIELPRIHGKASSWHRATTRIWHKASSDASR